MVTRAELLARIQRGWDGIEYTKNKIFWPAVGLPQKVSALGAAILGHRGARSETVYAKVDACGSLEMSDQIQAISDAAGDKKLCLEMLERWAGYGP